MLQLEHHMNVGHKNGNFAIFCESMLQLNEHVQTPNLICDLTVVRAHDSVSSLHIKNMKTKLNYDRRRGKISGS